MLGSLITTALLGTSTVLYDTLPSVDPRVWIEHRVEWADDVELNSPATLNKLAFRVQSEPGTEWRVRLFTSSVETEPRPDELLYDSTYVYNLSGASMAESVMEIPLPDVPVPKRFFVSLKRIKGRGGFMTGGQPVAGQGQSFMSFRQTEIFPSTYPTHAREQWVTHRVEGLETNLTGFLQMKVSGTPIASFPGISPTLDGSGPWLAYYSPSINDEEFVYNTTPGYVFGGAEVADDISLWRTGSKYRVTVDVVYFEAPAELQFTIYEDGAVPGATLFTTTKTVNMGDEKVTFEVDQPLPQTFYFAAKQVGTGNKIGIMHTANFPELGTSVRGGFGRSAGGPWSSAGPIFRDYNLCVKFEVLP